jgi:hypothetical protein
VNCPMYGQCKLKVVWLKPEYCISTEVPRGSESWGELYAKRVSVEMVFSRLKAHRRLDSHYIRGFDKVRLHCLLSVLSLQAKVVSSVTNSQPEKARTCTSLMD